MRLVSDQRPRAGAYSDPNGILDHFGVESDTDRGVVFVDEFLPYDEVVIAALLMASQAQEDDVM